MEEERSEIKEANPHTCRFVVTYTDGSILKGNALSTSDWSGKVSGGISKLEYEIDGVDKIEIKESKAYFHSVDYGKSEDKFIYYFIKVKCLTEDEVLTYSINLRDVPGSALRIGDIITGREEVPKNFNSLWKASG